MRGLTATAALFVLTAFSPAQQGRQPAPAGNPARPEPRREASVPFRIGETLTYDVSYSQFLTAGTAVVKVAEKKPSFSSTAYYVVADGRPVPLVAMMYPLYYKMDALIDSYTMLSQWTGLYQEEGARRHSTSTRFNRAGRKAYYEVASQPPVKQNFAVPANVQDGLSALFSLRTRSYKTGERFTIPVADDGDLFTVDIRTGTTETVKVPYGTVSAWHLTATAIDANRKPVGSNIGIWIGTDGLRLPVKMQADLSIGSFVLGLRDAH